MQNIGVRQLLGNIIWSLAFEQKLWLVLWACDYDYTYIDIIVLNVELTLNSIAWPFDGINWFGLILVQAVAT